ncbi:MAG: glycosyltransferase family 39 protein, partial [Acidobacteriota bacterium]
MPSRSPQPYHAGSIRLIVACVVVVAVTLAIRTLAVAEPLGIDQSLWASAVRGMARGQLLYRDVWEQRPPGIYLTYLAGFSIAGWSASAVVWLDVVASAMTSAMLFAIGAALGDRRTGAVAAALFALLTMPAWLYSYGGFLERAICETFIVVCVGGAVLCAVRLRQRASHGAAWGFGLLAGAAFLFKPNAALYFPGLLTWALAGKGAASTGRRSRTAIVAEIAVTGSILPILTVIWLWQIGVLADAKTAVVDFNRWYVSVGFEAGPYLAGLWSAIKLRATTDALWFAGGVASFAASIMLIRDRRLPSVPTVALIWGAGAFLVIVVNGKALFPSYFSQGFAPLALLVAWWLSSAESRSVTWRAARAVTAMLMVALLWRRGFVPRIVTSARADAAVLSGRIDRTSYLDRFGGYANGRGYSARANAELADYIGAHTAVDDTIYLFGINGAGIYFQSDRLTAHRFLRVNFFFPSDFPDPRFRLGAVVRDL